MSVAGSRVAVVGGSIAGCAAAAALRRAGCEVTVYERSHGELRERGAGIALPIPLVDRLQVDGYLDRDMRTCVAKDRLWLTRDGSDPMGRTIWRHPFPAVLNNWAILWRTLYARIPADTYASGTPVTSVTASADGVTVSTADGSRGFDALVGADGHNSVARPLLGSASTPGRAPYVAWRGTLDSGKVTRGPLLEALRDTVVTVCFERGHAMVYLVPGADDGAPPLVNWVVYAPTRVAIDTHSYLPPGHVPAAEAQALLDLACARLPPAWADLVEVTGHAGLAVQPVEDLPPAGYGLRRVVLVGDAASVSRPHTGSGAVKALQDAVCLERLARSAGTWADLSAAYDAERRPAAGDVVRLGRAFGDLLVERTPAWTSLGADDLRTRMADAQRGSQWCYATDARGRQGHT